MTSEAATVLRDALALSEGDRADLAAALLASLPVPEGGLEVDSDEWMREIERRARSLASGETQLEDWEIVEQRIRAKLSGG